MTESEVAAYIYANYDPVITKVVMASPSPVTAPILAGIIHRESAGGLTLKPPGPAGTGDGGHGRGLCQIDDRYYPRFCAGEDWKDPFLNISLAKEIIEGNYYYLIKTYSTSADTVDFEKTMTMACAAYNCGLGGVKRGMKAGYGYDHFTTGGNYGMEVTRLSKVYKVVAAIELAKAKDEPNSPAGV